MSLYQFCADLVRQFPRLFMGNIGLALLLAILDMANLFSLAPIVALLTSEGEPDKITQLVSKFIQGLGIQSNSIIVYISLFVVLNIASSLMLIGINYFILKAQFLVRKIFVLGLSEDLLYSSINFINQQRQGDFINVMTKEVAQVADAFSALSRTIAPIAQAIVLLAVPFYISWQTSALALICAIILVAPLKLAQKHLYKWGRAIVIASNDYNSTLQEILSNVGIISGFANEANELKRLNSSFSKLRKASIALQLIQSTINHAYNPIGIILVFATYLIGQHLKLALAETMVILLAFHRLSAVLRSISINKNLLITCFPSYELIETIRNGAKKDRLIFGTHKVNKFEKSVVFKNVSFSYPGSKNVLKNIDLTLPNKRMTALVGASGAGKSTIADILLGLQQVNSGQILINDMPFTQIDISSYKKKIGYVPQQSSLFNTTVRDNILWANPDATEEEVLAVCHQANAYQFIEELENGLDTIVGDRGVQLSGGQVQRIALARALIRNPELLILDEATSALDSESEQLIQQSISDIVGKSTLLVIAHRLSTIRKAECIYVLDKGQIVESGNFDHLVEKNGHFASLVERQKL